MDLILVVTLLSSERLWQLLTTRSVTEMITLALTSERNVHVEK